MIGFTKYITNIFLSVGESDRSLQWCTYKKNSIVIDGKEVRNKNNIFSPLKCYFISLFDANLEEKKIVSASLYDISSLFTAGKFKNI
jgi:hypothetical protein